LKHPKKLHDDHSDFPLAPEVFTPPGSKHEKLDPHLGVGRNYIVSVDNLNYYLSKGVTSEKIHKVFRYCQEAWLKPYVYRIEYKN